MVLFAYETWAVNNFEPKGDVFKIQIIVFDFNWINFNVDQKAFALKMRHH